ncbi:TolC family protein [uncultured Bacteroides sp.]|uniref:TolC family protein n=1 Tax=uncultured Bacteroides sp. TaxID=162156 RepID=UPI002AAB7108|nr:TolC family protein [uncultured Bacteroides sp.]
MKKKNIALLSLFLLSGLSISAQEVLTLEQCKKLALENNVKIRNARLEQSASNETKKEAFTNYFPVVSATGEGFNANKGIISLDLAGMSMSMLKNGVVGGVTATQPVFAGGKIANGNKLAQLGTEVSGYQMKLSEDEVSVTAEQYYWQIVSLQEKMKTIQIVEKMLENLHKDVTAAYKAGTTNKNDVLRVELKQNEIASNKLKVENGLSISKLALCQYMGIASKDFVTDTAAFSSLASPLEYKVNHEETLRNRTEYKLLDKNVEANRLQTKMKIGEYMPQVAVGAGYMYNYLMDKNSSFGILYATVSVPISGWWGGSHAIKKQKLNEKMAENTKQNNSELLIIQMQQLWNELEEAYKQVNLAEKSVQSSSENLRLNTDFYKAGTVALNDLLDAETLLQQSRDQNTEARVNYLVKKTKYLQATGR